MTTPLRDVLKSQYRAGLAMLREAVEKCPETEWTRGDRTNAFWQIAYHALFFTHLYLQTDEAAFRPWEQHRGDVQHPDGIPGPADPKSPLPLVAEPYTREQVLAYCDHCERMVDGAVDALDLDAPESGFYWYPVSKLEHQLINLRHLQHHAAQLADRLRSAADVGIRWVGSGSRR